LGAGFSIDKGMTTTVKVYKDFGKNYNILLNGINSADLKVSKFVIEQYLGMTYKPYFISVEHESEIPIGYGLGSSGSAALSLSYALNDALKTNLTKTQAARIAHSADVICKTGLGTVISEFTGGFEIRTGIGGPGIGKIMKIPVPNEYCAVILCIKPINTGWLLGKSHLSDKKNSLNELGKSMINTLKQSPTIETFLELSNDFARKFGLLDEYCKDPFLALKSVGVKSSVALFGHALFTVVKRRDLDKVIRVLNGFDGKLIVCGIDNSGAKMVEKSYDLK